MTHLVVHLIDELNLCGHVHSHWMYPIEWAMKDLKSYVCIEYMQGFSATRCCVWDANEDKGVVGEVLEGVLRPCTLSQHLRNTTHLYV
jgi:hypothetical protein